MQVNVYLRSSRNTYGAERYALSIWEVLTSHRIHCSIRYLTSSHLLIPTLFQLLISLFKHSYSKCQQSVDIYQFPFHPFRITHSRLRTVIIVFHHADITGGTVLSRLSEFYGLMTLRFLPATTKFVVVSEYWQRYLYNKGFTNINLIRNSIPLKLSTTSSDSKCFDPDPSYQFSSTFLSDNFSIYLGIARSSKGWAKISRTVRRYFPNAEIWLSSSSPSPKFTRKESKILYDCKIQVKSIPNTTDFYSQLKNVSLSIHNSQFKEGWNRTLVETALLSNSITLCSHDGGMIDVANIIPWIVPYANCGILEDHLRSISQPYQYNEQLRICLSEKTIALPQVLDLLSAEYFSKSWIDLLETLCIKSQ